MVGVDSPPITANLTTFAEKLSISNGIAHRILGFYFIREPSLILSLILGWQPVPPLPVIFPIVFNFISPVSSDISLVALLTLVDSAIRHFRVLVEGR